MSFVKRMKPVAVEAEAESPKDISARFLKSCAGYEKPWKNKSNPLQEKRRIRGVISPLG